MVLDVVIWILHFGCWDVGVRYSVFDVAFSVFFYVACDVIDLIYSMFMKKKERKTPQRKVWN